MARAYSRLPAARTDPGSQRGRPRAKVRPRGTGMREIVDGIVMWSWLSEPHGYNFNGYFVRHPGGNLCIDPVEPGDDVLALLRREGVARILITNRNHVRKANLLREKVMDDPPRLRESVEALTSLEIDTLLVGDGEPILDEVGSRLRELVATFPAWGVQVPRGRPSTCIAMIPRMISDVPDAMLAA